MHYTDNSTKQYSKYRQVLYNSLHKYNYPKTTQYLKHYNVNSKTVHNVHQQNKFQRISNALR